MTDAQRERLAMLAEECGEVVQIVGKILRHGYDNYHPDDPSVSNCQLLGRELCDLIAVAQVVIGRDDVPGYNDCDLDRAWKKKLKFAYCQEELLK